MNSLVGDDPVGTVEVALSHARRMLVSRPDLAAAQAREILKEIAHPEASLLLGIALRLQGDFRGAKLVLMALLKAQPKSAAAHYEAGLALAALGESRHAIAVLNRATELNPNDPHAWRALANEFTAIGDEKRAEAAYARQILASVNDPLLIAAADALVEGKLAVTEHLLRDFLMDHPNDIVAMRMLAEAGTRLGRYGDVEKILESCLELAPAFVPARYNYAIVLYRQNRAAEALPHIELLRAEEPENLGYRNLHAAALSLVGEYAHAIALYEEGLRLAPEQPLIWLSYGHALRTSGRQREAITAYRHALEQMPGLGEAYFSLANLKTFQFTKGEIASMRRLLERNELLSEDDRVHLHFALGKALEDEGDFRKSFEQYAAGAAERRSQITYDGDENHMRIERSRKLFTKDFVTSRANQGHPAKDPIFIVGLPRSGSTLIEQILSSHSQVEGTMELPDINALAMNLGHSTPNRASDCYPNSLADLNAEQLRSLGEQYLSRTRIQRKTNKPLFIDKMPNNFQHLGLIHLILPNAKIVDARRHPLATCFSAFKQHFARGQNYSYDLAELGRYYRDYVAMMAHFDEILPGRVHRVFYERLIENEESEIRRLLEYCGLPFESNCLRFYENDRAVRTASSEQVRQPIFRTGVDQWRNYEPWLDTLKQSLGDVINAYPAFLELAAIGGAEGHEHLGISASL